jgi:hypothetical protein
VRSIHNDGPGIASVVMCSPKIDDLEADTVRVEDFWPES